MFKGSKLKLRGGEIASLLLALLLIGGSAAWAVEDKQEAEAEEPEHVYDPDNGEEIMETCAGCHGKFGEGGGDGSYPRLAGLKDKYIAAQLRDFKSRERINIPMFPYATERELPESDVMDVAIYLSELELLTKMPRQEEEMDALERLRLAKTVFNVPRVPGDIEKGETLYKAECKSCHGKDGWGRGRNPQLAGQYTDYQRRQIRLIREGKRKHKKTEKNIGPLSDEQLEDIWAFLSTVDDKEDPEE